MRFSAQIFLLSFLAGAAGARAAAEEPTLFACAASELVYTVEGNGAFAAAPLETGECARLVRANGAVLTVTAVREASVPALIEQNRAAHQAARATVEMRDGDPIVMYGQSIVVSKYFGELPPEAPASVAPFAAVAWLKAGTDVVVGFTLAAPTRAAFDATYQDLRRLVRTYRPVAPTASKRRA